MSIWKDIHQRSNGETVRKEDYQELIRLASDNVVHMFDRYKNLISNISDLQGRCNYYYSYHYSFPYYDQKTLNENKIDQDFVDDVLASNDYKNIRSLHLRLIKEIADLNSKEVKLAYELDRLADNHGIRQQRMEDEMRRKKAEAEAKKKLEEKKEAKKFLIIKLIIAAVITIGVTVGAIIGYIHIGEPWWFGLIIGMIVGCGCLFVIGEE